MSYEIQRIPRKPGKVRRVQKRTEKSRVKRAWEQAREAKRFSFAPERAR